MGIAYRCNVVSGLSISVWHGEVTPHERALHLDTVAADPEWGAGRLIVSDISGVTASSPPDYDISESAQAFLQVLAGPASQAKWAIVANHAFDDARSFGEHIESEVPRLIVFNDLETACSWLGVDGAAVRVIVNELRDEIRSREVPA